MGNTYCALGKIRNALEAYEQAFLISHETGDRVGESAVLGNMGNAHYVLGLRRADGRLVRRRPGGRPAGRGRCGPAARAAVIAALLAALAVAPVTPSVPAPAATTARAPARLLVEAREFNLVLSRRRVPAGRAIVQLANRGEDPHDLRLRRRKRIGETPPGEVGEWEGRLRPGRYRLACTLPDHRRRGMRAVLRVR
jgi:hypothetical protein